MAVRIKVTGAEQVRLLGKELRALGVEGKGFRLELLRAIRAAASSAPDAAKASARETLPHGGGLNEYIARSRISVRTRLTGRAVGVRIQGAHGNLIDSGTVRHPVPNRKKWASNEVTPGWFTKPMEAEEPAAQAAVLGVVLRTRLRLERGH